MENKNKQLIKYLISNTLSIVLPLMVIEWMSGIENIDDIYKIVIGNFLLGLLVLLSIQFRIKYIPSYDRVERL